MYLLIVPLFHQYNCTSISSISKWSQKLLSNLKKVATNFTYFVCVFPEESDVPEHVNRKLSHGACLQMTSHTVLIARHILVQVEPVRQFNLDRKIGIILNIF